MGSITHKSQGARNVLCVQALAHICVCKTVSVSPDNMQKIDLHGPHDCPVATAIKECCYGDSKVIIRYPWHLRKWLMLRLSLLPIVWWLTHLSHPLTFVPANSLGNGHFPVLAACTWLLTINKNKASEFPFIYCPHANLGFLILALVLIKDWLQFSSDIMIYLRFQQLKNETV